MSVNVRRATRGDLRAILKLYEEDRIAQGRDVSHQNIERAELAFDDLDRDPRELVLVAELEGAVVGTLQLTMLRHLTFGGARVALVEAVHVDASVRSRGIGEAMMRFAIDEARRRGAHRIQLTSNKKRTRAHAFYERLGFIASHEGMKLYL